MKTRSTQPYIGLRAFERDETDIFFGREQHSDELIKRLSSNHFLAVIGTSGCGKSSLLKAGLIAGLKAGYLASVGTHWRIVEMRPGNQPFKELADKLFTELNDVLAPHYTAETLQHALRQGSLSLHELLNQHPLPNNAQLLIVCDQFEEVFRYFKEVASAEACLFVSLLLASSQAYPLAQGLFSHSMYVVITMRSDFLGECAQFAGLAEAINQGLYLTPRLNPQQLRAAIEEPAFIFDGEVEPELVVKLLEDAGNSPDQLPLLQHVLMRLWDLSNNKTLTLADYENLGELIRTGSPSKDCQSCDNDNALSRHADEVLHELNASQQATAKQIFCRLTNSETGKKDTRNPVKVEDLLALTGLTLKQLEEVLKPFRQAGRCFLMPPMNVPLTEDRMIDISHESLIRQWQTLQKWVADEAQAAQTYRHLLESALRYRNHQVGLLQSPELDIMLQWRKSFQPTAQWAKRYGKYEEDFPRALDFLSKSAKWSRIKTLFNIAMFVFMTALAGLNFSLYQKTNKLYETEREREINNLTRQADMTKDLFKMISKFKDDNEILDFYEKQTQIHPFNDIAWSSLAKIYESKGDKIKDRDKSKAFNYYNKAINAYKKTVEIDPESRASWFKLARVYQKKEAFDEAVSNYEQQIKVNEISIEDKIRINYLAWSWYYLGEIYEKQQNLNDAILVYKKTININKNNKDKEANVLDDMAWFKLGSIYNLQGDKYFKNKNSSNCWYQNAIRAYKTVISISPESKVTYFYLGEVYRKLGKFDTAILNYKKQIEVNKSYKNDEKRLKASQFSWYELGKIYENNYKINDAINAYQEVTKINPNYKEAWLKLKFLYQNTGNNVNLINQELVRIEKIKITNFMDMSFPMFFVSKELQTLSNSY
jgi:tetratricopeptide (TPR) repeat protein